MSTARDCFGSAIGLRPWLLALGLPIPAAGAAPARPQEPAPGATLELSSYRTRESAAHRLTFDVHSCGISGGVCTVTLPAGTPVLLRPDTASLENNQFAGWTGCDAIGTLFACSLTMTSDRTLTAGFRP